MRITATHLLTTALAMTAALACNPKSSGSAIASPDPHAARPGATTADPAIPAAPPKTVASVCSDAQAVASAHGGSPYVSRGRDGGDAVLGVLGMAGKPDGYSMAELTALEKKGQNLELLHHIEDISPTARGAAWDAMLTRVGTTVVGGLAKDGDTYQAFEALMTAEGLAKRYPQLTTSSEFMAKRGEAGKHMFAKCFQLSYSGEECVAMALDFVRVDGTDAKVTLAVAKIVGSNQNPYVAVPFFRAAIQGNDRAACGDDGLEAATTAGLGLPPDYPNAKTSREIAQNVCFAELEKPIVAKLTGDDGGGYFKDNACAVLRAKGVVK